MKFADNKYYVYIYIDPRNGAPFYVGKGCGLRMFVHTTDCYTNDHTMKSRIILKLKRYGLNPIIKVPFKHLPEEEAFELEKDLIFVIGRVSEGTGPLANCDEGGLGSGVDMTEEVRKKISINHHDISGSKNPNYGNYKPLSKEHRRKLSESQKGKRLPKEHREKIRQASIGRYFPPEHRQKLREAWKRRKSREVCCD